MPLGLPWARPPTVVWIWPSQLLLQVFSRPQKRLQERTCRHSRPTLCWHRPAPNHRPLRSSRMVSLLMVSLPMRMRRPTRCPYCRSMLHCLGHSNPGCPQTEPCRSKPLPAQSHFRLPLGRPWNPNLHRRIPLPIRWPRRHRSTRAELPWAYLRKRQPKTHHHRWSWTDCGPIRQSRNPLPQGRRVGAHGLARRFRGRQDAAARNHQQRSRVQTTVQPYRPGYRIP